MNAAWKQKASDDSDRYESVNEPKTRISLIQVLAVDQGQSTSEKHELDLT